MENFKIIKQDYLGHEVWEYSGSLVQRHKNKIVIEAYFDREETPVDKLILREGDRFVETYFLDKWFNIYEIQNQQNWELKAWYCNISFPAEFVNNRITYRDLELDLLVYPDGRQKVLDIAEFEALPLNNQVRSKALQALKELQEIFLTNKDYLLTLD
ncbi:MAG: DUF402 domain-containing protein [Anaerolineales bacterium]|nr:DUF402 domain-containing protein [Anaerolineales bacterium]